MAQAKLFNDDAVPESKQDNFQAKPNLMIQPSTKPFLRNSREQTTNTTNRARAAACGSRAEAHYLNIPPPNTPVPNSRSPTPSLSLSPDSGDSPIDDYDQSRIVNFNAVAMRRPNTVSARVREGAKDFEFKEADPNTCTGPRPSVRPQSTVGAGHFMTILDRIKNEKSLNLNKAQLVGDPIGRGADANVYKAKYKGLEIVLKKFKVKEHQHENVALFRFENELRILKLLQNQRVVLFFGFHLTTHGAHPDIRIAFEWAPHGSLFSRLHPLPDQERLSFRDALAILSDIAEGMHFIHSKRVIHRDLNPRNVLLYGDGSTAKITDFGESWLVDQNEDWEKPNIPENAIVGSPGFMAPEMLQAKNQMAQKSGKYVNNQYNYKVDVFAFGSVCFEALTRGFASAQKVLKSHDELKEGNQVSLFPEDCPEDFGTIMYECWSFDPTDRRDFNEIAVTLQSKKDEILASDFAKKDAL